MGLEVHTASVVYIAKSQGEPKGGDDAKEARVYTLEELPMDQLVNAMVGSLPLVKDFEEKEVVWLTSKLSFITCYLQ